MTACHQLLALAAKLLLRFSLGSCLRLSLCGQALKLRLGNGGSCRLFDLLILAIVLRIIQNGRTAIRHALCRFLRLCAPFLFRLLELLYALLLLGPTKALPLGNCRGHLFRLGHALGCIVQALRECHVVGRVCRRARKCVLVFCHCKFPQLKNL